MNTLIKTNSYRSFQAPTKKVNMKQWTLPHQMDGINSGYCYVMHWYKICASTCMRKYWYRTALEILAALECDDPGVQSHTYFVLHDYVHYRYELAIRSPILFTITHLLFCFLALLSLTFKLRSLQHLFSFCFLALPCDFAIPWSMYVNHFRYCHSVNAKLTVKWWILGDVNPLNLRLLCRAK